jgi:hypothetical protein
MPTLSPGDRTSSGLQAPPEELPATATPGMSEQLLSPTAPLTARTTAKARPPMSEWSFAIPPGRPLRIRTQPGSTGNRRGALYPNFRTVGNPDLKPSGYRRYGRAAGVGLVPGGHTPIAPFSSLSSPRVEPSTTRGFLYCGKGQLPGPESLCREEQSFPVRNRAVSRPKSQLPTSKTQFPEELAFSAGNCSFGRRKGLIPGEQSHSPGEKVFSS